MNSEHLWAPWRMQYIEKDESGLPPSRSGCFFCDALAAGDESAEHLVLGRGDHAFVMMNRFPYNMGHLLVACNTHVGEVGDVEAPVAMEMFLLMVTCKDILGEVMKAEGYNMGINQGACAGAGVLDHLHLHVVPRWGGDTNFMPVISGVKVMPQALHALYERLQPAFARRGIEL